jgi:H+/Cl- antiporter ClcA
MSRYYMSPNRRKPAVPTNQTPAIWRGIGCLLGLIVPLISWFLASGTLHLALLRGWPLPYQLLGYPVMPIDLWKVPGLPPILFFIEHQQHLYLALVLTVAYTVVISAVLSFGYALVYRFVGPPRYGPLDLPQLQYRVGRYKR